MSAERAVHRGSISNGMEFLAWGGGPRALLFLPGGPGSGLPVGLIGQMNRRWFQPFVNAGFTVWYVTRRRGMPRGHSVSDMADDYAPMIAEQLGGRADLVVGESYGGMIALYLAARHPDRVGHVAVVIAGAQVSAWGKDVDARLVAALERGERSAAGAAFAEYAIPGPRGRGIRRLLGPFIGLSLLSGKSYPASDVLVEVEAELAFDARPALPDIAVPVILLCGDEDRFFPPDVVEETARLIPGSTRVRYAGQGHFTVATGSDVPRDILRFVDRS